MTDNESFPVGSSPVVSSEFRVAGVLTDPGVVTATLEDPDGTETSPAVQKVDVGKYSFQFLADKAGLWHYRFDGTAPAVGATEGDVFIATSPIVDGYPSPPYTYDLGSSIGQVRLYIDDRDLTSVSSQTPREQRSAIFDDDEIQVFLNQANGDVMYASARALMTIANNRQLMVQSRRVGKTAVDFGGIRRDLVAQAKELVLLSTVQPASGFAEINWNDFTARDIILNAELRDTYSG